MVPNPRNKKALRAMKDLGIAEAIVKPVLKNLLEVYEKNWELIEADNYRVLTDAIFDESIPEDEVQREDAPNGEEAERPLKRFRRKCQEVQISSPVNKTKSGVPGTSLTRANDWELIDTDNFRVLTDAIFYEPIPEDEVQREAAPNGEEAERPLKRFRRKCQEVQISSPVNKTKSGVPGTSLTRPNESPLRSDLSHNEGTLVIHPSSLEISDSSSISLPIVYRSRRKITLNPPDVSGEKTKRPGYSSSDNQVKEKNNDLQLPKENLSVGHLIIIPRDEPINNDLEEPMPICFLRREQDSPTLSEEQRNGDVLALSSETRTNDSPTKDTEKSTTTLEIASTECGRVKINLSYDCDSQSSEFYPPTLETVLEMLLDKYKKKYEVLDSKFSFSKVMDDICNSFLELGNDVAKGQEIFSISLVNDVNEECPPFFYYITQNAAVNVDLARIGDKSCSSSFSVDCLSLSSPCACAHKTGGELAYTKDGLVKEKLLEECISMNCAPEKHQEYFCKECPLERAKFEDTIEPCKGHLFRKFIKECWGKCGCDEQCGNRVVQRGITRKLQVFMTAEGKGWGLRTLEDLPKGAFVCEYVGEVLTNAELFNRVEKRQCKGEKCTFPVLLDADWRSKGVLKDEEALCLDPTIYGNVARFINHRCHDANMIGIPVEIETPDHHYYHLAFFTSRKVKRMEELTWDYGIDFDDIEHPIKAFSCHCGSTYCRNMRRTKRKRYLAICN